MIVFPAKWEGWVEMENNFWVSKRFLSPSIAKKIITFEKGIGQKILVAIGLIGFLAVIYLNAK
jgi:hypothetical protein